MGEWCLTPVYNEKLCTLMAEHDLKLAKKEAGIE